MKYGIVKKRTAEYRISNRRISKGGFALLSPLNKIDRIRYFDIRYSLFDIRYSLCIAFPASSEALLESRLRDAPQSAAGGAPLPGRSPYPILL